MKRIALLLLLLWPALATAQFVRLPAELKGEPGAWLVLVPDAKEGGDVKWKVSPGLTLVPLDKLFPGQKAAGIVIQGPAGTYQVWAWNAKADIASDLSICNIIIGTPPPPVPPVPPPPTPDALTEKLRPAYSADLDPDKATHAHNLAAVYIEGSNATSDVSLTTWGELFELMAAVAKRLGVSGKLPAVQQMLLPELAVLPSSPVDRSKPLDKAGRELASITFKRIGNAVEGLMK